MPIHNSVLLWSRQYLFAIDSVLLPYYYKHHHSSQRARNMAEFLAPTKITKPQRAWLVAEKKRTGNQFAAIIRNLIQEKISKEGK
jgi:hypothetical protein